MSLGGETAPRRPWAGGLPNQTLSPGDPRAQSLKRGRDGYRHERLDQTRRHPRAQEKAPGRRTTQRWHWPPAPAARVSPGTPEHSSPGKRGAHGFLSVATWGSRCPQPLIDSAPSPAGPDTRHHPNPLTPDRAPGLPHPLPGTRCKRPPMVTAQGLPSRRHASYSCWKDTPVLLSLQAAHPRHTRAHTHTHTHTGPGTRPAPRAWGQASAAAGAVHPRGRPSSSTSPWLPGSRPDTSVPKRLGRCVWEKGAGPSESYKST